MKNICVYGSSSAALEQVYFDSAYELGREIAKAGYGLVFGAGAIGVMGAVAHGVHSEKGSVLGVIPSFMNVDGIPYLDCNELIVTETMRDRKRVMEEHADAFIMAPGGIGTFEEFFEILTLKQLRQHQKAIIVLNTNGYYDHLQSMMERCVNEQFAKKETLALYEVAATPAQAVELVQNYVFQDFPIKWFTETEGK